jgi:GNAT superfamily N-acetyltransferase
MQLKPRQIQTSYLGTKPSRAVKQNALSYSKFLAQYFSSTYPLQIPPKLFENLESTLTGAELRTSTNQLVGVAFSFYLGKIDDVEAGLITWLCVHPEHRKKGVADVLLHAVQTYTYPRTIHFFRNDGWLKSPLPPIWTETRIFRKQMYRPSKHVQRVSLESKRDLIKASWKKDYPDGLILDDPKHLNPLTEVWTYRSTVLLLQPTFEQRWCEVLYWVSELPNYETALNIEIILDTLPYTHIDAPQQMPHTLEWSVGGQSTWCAHGLDPGSPVLRPILSLLTA